MIRLDERIRRDELPARMLMQVHDELVFEVAPEQRAALRALVREKMEGVMALRVPLVVDVGEGLNWREAH